MSLIACKNGTLQFQKIKRLQYLYFSRHLLKDRSRVHVALNADEEMLFLASGNEVEKLWKGIISPTYFSASDKTS